MRNEKRDPHSLPNLEKREKKTKEIVAVKGFPEIVLLLHLGKIAYCVYGIDFRTQKFSPETRP